MLKVYQRGQAKTKPIGQILARMIDFVVVHAFIFVKNGFFASIFFLITENGYRSFIDVSQMYRNDPFIILDEELFQGMNDSLNTTGFTQLARERV